MEDDQHSYNIYMSVCVCVCDENVLNLSLV